jgi:hypothetical protein
MTIVNYYVVSGITFEMSTETNITQTGQWTFFLLIIRLISVLADFVCPKSRLKWPKKMGPNNQMAENC